MLKFDWLCQHSGRRSKNHQTYFSFPSPAPFPPRMRTTRKNTDGLRDYIYIRVVQEGKPLACTLAGGARSSRECSDPGPGLGPHIRCIAQGQCKLHIYAETVREVPDACDRGSFTKINTLAMAELVDVQGMEESDQLLSESDNEENSAKTGKQTPLDRAQPRGIIILCLQFAVDCIVT